jgi:tetratricopeptide (TPR) repeat protein
MAVFKCKICGGTLELDGSQTVATCDYCGTRQTIPKLDDDRKANLYDRANHFRRNNDFDKAMGIYENILNEDNADAEAYWSIVLCRYGIEYVEDPTTRKRVPTVNRAQFTSIFDDEDYKSAMANADCYQREIYEAEANAINAIQKGILAISQKEEPFDVFICYKETDERGRRTQDSVLATELYHELSREGFKVFFSRITLEDKLGVAYEPYIFAALNSAKVMVVLGTKPDHFNAVWVRNEWSRFLALIKNGARKTLIPAYRDMDPYDLPEEFSHLQAQDMAKLGFMQDLIHGIKKIVGGSLSRPIQTNTTVDPIVVANVAPLLKRAFLFLEDGEFDRADEFFEQILNQDPENAQAYLGKLMIDMGVNVSSDLAELDEPIDMNRNYQKVIRFADGGLASTLREYNATIRDRNAVLAENRRKDTAYTTALNEFQNAKSIAALRSCKQKFVALSGWRDSDAMTQRCDDKIEQIRVAIEAERIKRERLAEQ